MAPVSRLRNAFRINGNRTSKDDNTIWALRDVSFEIERGEIIGIIGRNGAGKSTLLKVLARITEPTAGYAEIVGRIGSLLEIGTGFHPELTGRENIVLNGAILGMRHYEIERKLNEIVAFAEIERFIDTPVKHYSSGMYLRLAFSVAAHLEPEILLVDEVLAVGDLAFQKKCLEKMGDVAANGRTVVFVSHNLVAVKELCQTALVLSNGSVEFRGPVVEALACYTHSIGEDTCNMLATATGWRGVRVDGQHNGFSTLIDAGQPLTIRALLDLDDDVSRVDLFCILNDSLGVPVIHQRVSGNELWSGSLQAGRYRLNVDLPPLWLAPGVYILYFKLLGGRSNGAQLRQFSDRVIVDVMGSYMGISRASLAPPARWSISNETRYPSTADVLS